MLSFRIFGFPVQVHWMFWLLCVFLAMPFLSRPGPEGLGSLLVVAAVVFASILWHELGHAFARRRFGAPHSEIILYGFGGLCSGPGRFTRKESILISAAGPAANLLVGAAALLALSAAGLLHASGGILPWRVDYSSMNFFAAVAVMWLLFANIGWSILNLLPIYPLDGGQIVAHALDRRHFPAVLKLGIVLGVVIAVAGFLRFGSLLLLVLFGLLAWSNWQQLRTGRAGFP